MQVLAAALPIAAVLALMLGLRWSAARAGAIGLVLALAVGSTIFDLAEAPGGLPGGAGGALLEAAFTAALIIWIIVPALAIHRLQTLSGAVEQLRRALVGVAGDPRISALLVAWFFALLIEGAAGFGTAAALAAPFLVSLGVSPLAAVATALVGHAVGVSFGAVGTPILPQEAASGLPALELSRATVMYAAILGWGLAAAVAVMISHSMRGVATGARLIVWTPLAALTFLVPFAAIGALVGPELPTLGGAVVGGAAFVTVRLLTRHAAVSMADGGRGGRGPAGLRQAAQAAAPYLALVGLVLVTRLGPGVREALQGVLISWELTGTFRGSFAPLFHPGTMLFAALLVGAVWQGSLGHARHALGDTLRRMPPVVLALLAMLGLSRVMVHAGMVEVLAMAAAEGLGAWWPLFAPSVGALGTFVTGSATAANVLFSDLQVGTADAIGLGRAALLGAQGFGAAIGNAMAPHNVIAACAVVGLAGREADVLRRTVPLVLGYLLISGALALILAGEVNP